MAAATLVAACGEPDATTSSSSPSSTEPSALRPPVVVNAESGSSAGVVETARPMSAGDAASTEMTTMPAFAGFTYEIGDGLPALPANSTGYQFPAGADVDEATVAALAEALGVDAPERVDDPNTGLLWKAGPDDGTAPTLGVSNDPQLSWYYSAAWDEQDVATRCAVPLDTATSVPVPVGQDASAPSVEPTTTTSLVGGDAVGGSAPPCAEPEPPAGVPSAAEAEASARDLLATLGQDPAAFELETYADEWSAFVVAWPSVDGVRWPVSWGFTFGAEGVLQGANGAFAEPLAFGPYPLVDLDTAVVRLGEQGGWMPFVATDVPTDTSGVAELEVATLVDVRPDFWWAWDADGSVWLLPAYTFVDTEERIHTVPAVTDEYLIVEPPPTTVPPTTLPVTSEATDPIIGLSVDEATAALAAEGLTLRVVREDGVDLIVTEDYSESRVNVAVEAGVVTEVLGIG
jgi:hypothetical protein